MNNRYLFRAKRIDTGEWVKGFYAKARIGNDGSPSDVIFVPWIENRNEEWGFIKVDPTTICQCTGLKKFFENDIVKRIDLHKVGEPEVGVIEYDAENTAFVIHWMSHDIYSPMYPWKDKVKVIGNIFDNPELLEVK